uniref:Uncharacterized protein n=1 Tax=Anguilla anguilla TaxID=7936 RepID=A0A0E9V9J4_ANGAN
MHAYVCVSCACAFVCFNYESLFFICFLNSP